MRNLRWEVDVLVSRLKNQARYIYKAPGVYKNWWALLIGKFGVGVILELRNGLRYLVRPGTTDMACVNEASLSDPYMSRGHISLSKHATVLDVGANIGDFTMQLSRLCPEGRIIAVEPVNAHIEMIKIQCLLNRTSNVICVHAALGSQSGVSTIQIKGGHSSLHWGDGERESVRVTTLQNLIEDMAIEEIDLLKLDCEGSEWDILPSSEPVLSRIQQICMEYHCARDWTAQRLASWLEERGFSVWHTHGSWNGLLWAVRKKCGDG